MPSWSFAQIGARDHYALARAAAADGRLGWLYTDFWAPGWLRTRVGRRLAPRAASRCHDRIPAACVRQPAFIHSLPAAFMRRFEGANAYDRYLNDGERFGRWLRAALQRDVGCAADAHLLVNTGALEGLCWLRERDRFAAVVQIDPARTEAELVRAEHQAWPHWAPVPQPVPQAYWERLAAEWDTATCIAVNSPWSADALVRQGVAADKLVVVPLAIGHAAGDGAQSASAPAGSPSCTDGSTDQASRPLTVLFLGQVCLRKGIHYLLQAAEKVNHLPIRIIVVGPIALLNSRVRNAPANVEFRGAVPRSAVNALYRQADVFVLPTLSDGFALTQLEAMAHGVPVIATPACGQVVQHGVSGWQVPCRDVDALVEVLGECEQDRARVRRMRGAARARAAQFSLAASLRCLDAAWATHGQRNGAIN